MNRFAKQLVLGPAILAVFGMTAGFAGAKPLKPVAHRHSVHPHYAAAPVTSLRPPLTINKRSFLDPGPVVPVGSESAYMVQNTYFATTPDQNFSRSKFGNEALPRPLEVPGRPAPIYEFETPGFPY